MKKCTECGQTNHTPAECKNGRVGTIMLFGVLIDPKIDPKTDRKGKEDDHNHDQDDNHNQIVNSIPELEIINVSSNEHTSDHLSDTDQRKKGVAWTEDEHKSFLLGLEEFGKGYWRAISKNYVPSRTPTQVASHAQKYFIRLNNDKGNRRSSLFDMSINQSSTAPVAPPSTSTRPGMRYTYSAPDLHYMQMGYENGKDPACSSGVATFVPMMKQDRINFSKADGPDPCLPFRLYL